VAADAALTADEALTRLYSEHFRTLVGIAALLTQDIVLAEEVTESAFAAAYGTWQQLRDTSTAADFLRREVVRLARDARRAAASAGRGSRYARIAVQHVPRPAGRCHRVSSARPR
jgi:DNA-directed RNA polymerase specialized sigma24 family protein